MAEHPQHGHDLSFVMERVRGNVQKNEGWTLQLAAEPVPGPGRQDCVELSVTQALYIKLCGSLHAHLFLLERDHVRTILFRPRWRGLVLYDIDPSLFY